MSGINFNITDNLANTPGSISRKRKTITGAIILKPFETYGALTTVAGAYTVTLPDASTVPAGHEMMVKDETGNVSSSNKITFDVTGGGTIDGVASKEMTKARGSVCFTSDGTNWHLASDFLAEAAGGGAATPPEFRIAGPQYVIPINFQASTYNFIPA